MSPVSPPNPPAFEVAIWDGQVAQQTRIVLPWHGEVPGGSIRIFAAGVEDRIKIRNLGDSRLELPWSHESIDPGTTREVPASTLLRLESHWIEIQPVASADTPRRSMRRLEMDMDLAESRGPVPAELLGQAPSTSTLTRWFEALGKLMSSPASSEAFLRSAGEMILVPGGLDLGLVLLRPEMPASTDAAATWEIPIATMTDPGLGFAYDPAIVTYVCQSRRGLFQDRADQARVTGMAADRSVVAVPLLDKDGEVQGILYGARLHRGGNQRRSIRPLEAQWMRLIASTVRGGLKRIQAEREAARTRVLFEQVFCGAVAKRLIDEPEFLEGREREVSILFADLRDSSRISAGLPLKDAYRLLGEVLDTLTDCVLELGGVIIDYHGDGLAAMWNAPLDHSDHAMRSVTAAVEMIRVLRGLNANWEHRLGGPLRIAVGIHTGLAEVGNAGSRRRLKYGPRGPTVNLASRLELASKRTGAPIVISEETRRRLPQGVITRRLGRGRFSGFTDTVPLFELCALASHELSDGAREALDRCEKALDLIDKGEPGQALQLLEAMCPVNREEQPSSCFWQERLIAWRDDPSQPGLASTELDLTARGA